MLFLKECRVLSVAKLGRQFTSLEKIVIPVKVTTSADFDVFPAKSASDCGSEASLTVHAVQYIGVYIP